ncbi:hypothetical protein ACLQ2R_17105 [Streptosporangium sp. DT93]|uniref:hypothetical protein n=1 Tax=Streptosporangium sp. DT93 TaxID=3393428 RepID=UPI003CED366C
MPEKRTSPQTRRTFHMDRIRGAKNGVTRFFLAAAWVASELKAFARRDAAKAHEQGWALADQLVTFAARLNDDHHTHLMTQRGGRARANA